MGSVPADLEFQKFQLDKETLAFEIRKFEADESKRKLESEKLAEEVHEMRRPWYQKASYLGPAVTITVAIIGGLIAFGTDVFKSNVVTLKNERDQLSQNVKGLGTAKEALSSENGKLSSANLQLKEDGDHLRRDVNALKGKSIDLLKDNQQLKHEKDRLSGEVVVTELRTHLAIIKSFGRPYNHLDFANQSLQNIFAISERFGGDATAISVLEEMYNSAVANEVKAALCAALFKASRKPEWKARLKQLSIGEILGAFDAPVNPLDGMSRDSIYLALLADDSVFTLDDKVSILKEMYAAAKTKSTFSELGSKPNLLGLIAGWNEDATVVFRDPWFDYLSRLYDLREWESTLPSSGLSGPTLLSFAPQAFGILLVASMSSSPSNRTGDWEISTGFLSDHMDCPYFPADFPLCTGFMPSGEQRSPRKESNESIFGIPPRGRYNLTATFSVSQASIPNYRRWVDSNRDLVSLWTDRTFTRLRAINPDVMRRVLHRGWISMADVGVPKQRQ